MPQILKKEVKHKIVSSAIDLMVEKGIQNTDMRSIAENAEITAGNLYRYFKNKEYLILCIIEPMTQEINRIIAEKSSNVVSADVSQINFEKLEKTFFNYENVYEYIRDISEEVILEIFIKGKEQPKIMRIIVDNDILSKHFVVWMRDVLVGLFLYLYDCVNESMVIDLIDCMTFAFCEGVAKLIRVYIDEEIDVFKGILDDYLLSQMSALKTLVEKKLKEKRIMLKEKFLKG